MITRKIISYGGAEQRQLGEEELLRFSEPKKTLCFSQRGKYQPIANLEFTIKSGHYFLHEASRFKSSCNLPGDKQVH